jgi:cytochrome bd-type quinol oxidase subunit 2
MVLFAEWLGLRGASYALRSGAREPRELLIIDGMFSIASLVTPFTLGAAAGAIAAQRVLVGDASGAPFGSWLAAVPMMTGLLAVVSRSTWRRSSWPATPIAVATVRWPMCSGPARRSRGWSRGRWGSPH